MVTQASSSLDAPIRIGAVTLVVRDLRRVWDFYRSVIGLAEVGADTRRVQLGVDGVPLVELIHRPEAVLASPRSAGLFHTAFLLPDRQDLASFLRHIVEHRVPIQGASDHGVSEAIYLADPEGNGIEVYCDRPISVWPRGQDGRIEMFTAHLDTESLLAEAVETGFAAAPIGTRIGHIHLQVGDVAATERFYVDCLGFETIVRMPSACFMSTGGYHHHVAANVWNSRGAGPRLNGSTGLVGFELDALTPAFETAERLILLSGQTTTEESDGSLRLTDPSGLEIHLKNA